MEEAKPRIGLLPLYIELYDKARPEMRTGVEKFLKTISSELGKRSLQVLPAPICRLKQEFAEAVKTFEQSDADIIVTLHLAYSPSLESSDVLAATKLPIVVLDTTPEYQFGPTQSPDEILYNHGIHGVQDMCNLLIRNKKPFEIEAGHWQKSNVLNRIAEWSQAARIAKSMRTARVGRVGKAFKGMGDFAVLKDVLKHTIGVETIVTRPEEIRGLLPPDNDKALQKEMAENLKSFSAKTVSPEANLKTAKTSLAVRRWIEQRKLTAFSASFTAIDKASGIPTLPFLEASKAMARGIGYAGEGDVLTAALASALMSVYPKTTFTEIFCPDWEKNRLFLSHMGEMNLRLIAKKPKLMEKQLSSFIHVANPLVAVGRFRAGKAVLVNLAPGPNNTFTLILGPGKMVEAKGKDKMEDTVHGWLKPAIPISKFLEEYSRAGGTHHSALVYGDVARSIVKFGKIMGWKVIKIA